MKFSIPVSVRKFALGGVALASTLTVASLSYRGTAGELSSKEGKHHSSITENSEIVRQQTPEECDCVPMWECMQSKCSGEICKSCENEEKLLRACLARVSDALIFALSFAISEIFLSPRPRSRLSGDRHRMFRCFFIGC